MDTAANFTTTVGGGVSLVQCFTTATKPLERVVNGEAHLNSGIFALSQTVKKRADYASRPEIRELRRQHDDISGFAQEIRATMKKPLSFNIRTIKEKINLPRNSRKFEREAMEFNADAQRSSRQAVSQEIKQHLGETDTIHGPEEPPSCISKNPHGETGGHDSSTSTVLEAAPPGTCATVSKTSEHDIALLPLSGPSKRLSSKDSSATLRASCRNDENPFADDSNDAID